MDLIWKMKSQVQPITEDSGKPGISSGKFNRLGCLRTNSGGKYRVFLVVDWILSNKCLD